MHRNEADEVSKYLHWILDNFERLPDYIHFFHNHEIEKGVNKSSYLETFTGFAGDAQFLYQLLEINVPLMQDGFATFKEEEDTVEKIRALSHGHMETFLINFLVKELKKLPWYQMTLKNILKKYIKGNRITINVRNLDLNMIFL